MAKSTTDVAIREEAALPAIIDFTADQGAGFEETDSSSYAIPFLCILQAISPQAKKQNAKYIQGAEEGDFFNTVTEKLYKGSDGVTVIPCHYIHKYNEWAPERGGFRGSHSAADYTKLTKEMRFDSKGNQYEANAESGNQLVDTREHYVIIVNADGSCEPAVLALSGSQLKKSKKWMTLMQGIRIGGQVAPMFSQVYKISPMLESNDKGEWSGLKFDHIGQVTSMDHYNAAKQFREMVRSGAASATPTGDEEVPF